MIRWKKRRPGRKALALAMLGLLLTWWFCLPENLFPERFATVVESAGGTLLGARLADDGQWRFPPGDSIPAKFEACIVQFEDAYFYSHPGFNPGSIAKALWHNLTRPTRRGGSTLTQQVMRLSRKNRRRTYGEKLVEIFMATRLEARYSKKEILNFFASHAPFGGNVVGLEAASWRYFGLPSHQLSWGQTAALAVLPNAPALVFPGQRDQTLLAKRDALLQKLLEKGVLDNTSYELARAEPLPQKPLPLPETAPHLVEHLRKQQASKRWKTSLDEQLQRRCNAIAENHHLVLKQNQIHNLAILVLEVPTQKVLAYVGNVATEAEHNPYVDIIQSPRSTGSVLKPLLFAAALDNGLLLPHTLVSDIPTVINGYSPKNFNEAYDGAVPADQALLRSLNVPAVRLLRDFGLTRFHRLLPKMGIESLRQPAEHYGLSLILGGGESSLWELTNAYAGMAETVNYYGAHSSVYRPDSFEPASFLESPGRPPAAEQYNAPAVGAGALFKVLEALQKVNRPNEQENWAFFDEAQPIAWKTGTSFGFKDAWAIGTTPRYAIGVWAGNADGEGRPGLTGIQAAAPVLFDVLEALPPSAWFREPYDDLVAVNTCSVSGYLPGPDCDATEEVWVPEKGVQTGTCPYHRRLHLDTSGKYQVNSDCYPVGQMRAQSWFVLPPVAAHYYSPKHPGYLKEPPFLPGCGEGNLPLMEFIFPERNEAILIPREFGGQLGQVVFKLAHRQPQQAVYWYLDDAFLGKTEQFHELAVLPKPGSYTLTVMDDAGNRLAQRVTIRNAGGQ